MPYPVPAGNVTINVNNHATVSFVSSVMTEWLLENCVSYQIRGSYILSNHVSFNVIISNPLNSACMKQTYFLGFAHLDVLVWLILQGIFQESKEVSEKFSVILINGYSFHTRNLAVIFAWFWSWCFWSIFSLAMICLALFGDLGPTMWESMISDRLGVCLAFPGCLTLLRLCFLFFRHTWNLNTIAPSVHLWDMELIFTL